MLRDEYMCALYKKILLQGKMFVFDSYICFHANVFGYVKKKVRAREDRTRTHAHTHTTQA